MKKLWICLMLCLTLCLAAAAPALATNSINSIGGSGGNASNSLTLSTPAPSSQTETEPAPVQQTQTSGQQTADGPQTLGFVTDMAGILSTGQTEALQAAAARVSEQYGCGVYVVVVQNYKTYTNGSVERCTEDLYHYFNLGLGDGRDGLILLMSMQERDYDLWGYGPFAGYAFTDYGLDQLEKSILPFFRENNWYGGFDAYIRGVESLLDAAARGEPVEYHLAKGIQAAIIAGPAALIGFGVCGGMKSKMKTAKERDTAEDYVVRGSAKLRVSTDQFINRTRSVTVIESSSSGGGGRTGGGGGGISHHSGKF